MAVERNNLMMERNGLKQQCTQAVHKWDITLRERNELQEALKKVTNLFYTTFFFIEKKIYILSIIFFRRNNNAKKR